MSEQWPDLGARVSRRGNRFTQWFGRTVFRAMGWRLVGQFPDRPKLIVAVAPHSSNIDFVLAAAVILLAVISGGGVYWYLNYSQARIEAEYDKDRIKTLIDNEGWA